LNCEKGDRECVYSSKLPRPNPSPIPPKPAISSHTHFAQPYTFQSTQSQPLNLPVPISPTQRHPYQDTTPTSHSQSLEPADPFESQESNTPNISSIPPSPQIHHHPNTTVALRPTTGTTLVSNALFVNNAQTQLQLQQAIHSLSNDFRLRGHPFTIESILLPLIYRSDSLKYAIIANFVLQAEQTKHLASPSWPAKNQNQNPPRLDVVYYRNAKNILQTTFPGPVYTDIIVGTALILAFYDICAGELDHFNTNMRNAADQIRLRGQTLRTHPLELQSKFLFNLFVKIDAIGSNVCVQQSTVDREIIEIVHSGLSIFSTDTLSYRMDLEFLLTEISRFQYECATVLPVDGDGNDPAQVEILRCKYKQLLDQLRRWQTTASKVIYFEKALPDYPLENKLPFELGLPLLCVTTLLIFSLY
jgi:hypothetical protein